MAKATNKNTRTVSGLNGTKLHEFRCEEDKFMSAAVWANPNKKNTGVRHSVQVQKGYFPTGSDKIANMSIGWMNVTELKCLIACASSALGELEKLQDSKADNSANYTQVSIS